MRRLASKFPGLLLLTVVAAGLHAQPNLSGAAEIRQALARLNVLGSVLMIGAHPDDEQTGTLAYLARGRALRTGYLSLTRGEGGQNLIGSELGAALGVIRTQELLAARRIDGAEQFFTRAIDFGFSKTADETLAKWGREKILADIVWVIRSFRPDVLIFCFSGTPRDGHGMHQASAMLGKEAFTAAADPKRFPEQLRWVEPWQARRALWNMYGRGEPQAATAGQVTLEIGDYDPVLGYSYAEIAGLSRSMHRTQAMGSPERRGAAPTRMVAVAGEPVSRDPLDGIDVTWSRVSGGKEIGPILAAAAQEFRADRPHETIPRLVEARRRIAGLKDFWARRKRAEIDETIALCAGLWLDAAAPRWDVTPGSKTAIRLTALNRSRAEMRLTGAWIDGGAPEAVDAGLAYNQPYTREATWSVPAGAPPSQPFWLIEPPQGESYTISDQRLIGAAENPPVVQAHFRLRIGEDELEYTRPVRYRYVDRARGEFTRPVEIVPPVAVQFSQPVLIATDARPREIEVVLRGNAPAAGEVRIESPRPWRTEPAAREFNGLERGAQAALRFQVQPPAEPAKGRARAVANGVSVGMQVIEYPHIEPQVLFPPATAELVRADIRILAKRIGYVMGAGDDVPEALRQLGSSVVLLGAQDLAGGDLGQFDAIVTGVRAFNVRADLRTNFHRLLDYVSNGGTLVVQYNVLDFGGGGEALSKIGPYPLRVGRDRVSVEEAPMTLPHPDSPLLAAPNRITPADFEGWVQERGLYFASEWDPRYQPLLESHDPGEPPRLGGTLYTRYGKGAYVFTAYSWFRQLPAGVPGAYRIFANLLSAGKTASE